MKPEYRNILFCSDFSPGADNAFFTALDLAERYRARLYLLHVIPEADLFDDSFGETAPGEPDSSPGAASMEKVRQKFEDRYVHRLGGYSNYAVQILRGVPIVEIVRFARDREVDVIVMGAAGSSNRNKLHFGSTAENVARRAFCTVMCIRKPQR
jgi:nucleotide-binding universal stress UspA family protein